MAVTKRDKTRSRIKEAAVALFLSRSPRLVTMVDIAEAAGLTRQTVYRLFNNRIELIEEILTDEVNDIKHRVVGFYLGLELEDAIVEGVMRALSEAENSPIVMAFFKEGQEHEIELFWTNHETEQWHFMLALWAPVFAQARLQDRIRPDTSDLELVDWIINVTQMLVSRTDYSADQRRAILLKFLVPALLRDRPAA